MRSLIFFFFQAEDGIRDVAVTGVQTCALPISNEQAMIKDMAESAGELLQAAGAKNIRTFANPSAPRWAVHEAGIARMGNDPKKSVLTKFQQTHDVRNLFVMDASGFTSNPCQNPTLTIMALCVRSCDYLMDEMKRGNI